MEFTDRWDDPVRAAPGTSPIAFGEPETGHGIRIHDRVERRQFDVDVPAPVSPTHGRTEDFVAPVDASIEFRTSSLSFDQTVALYVRDPSWELLDVAEKEMRRHYAADSYLLELNPPIKVYLRFDGELTIRSDADHTVLDFGDTTTVRLGARSYHERPAATITTTADPKDMMVALSSLGSAMKTWSPERSYPTLRGHPPEIELGDKLDVPPDIAPPDTGITIEVPPELPSVYDVAPLAFYLGATFKEGAEPRIVTERGFTHSLAGSDDIWAAVRRTLGQQFLVDCVARTEGLYTIDLYEREVFEGRVDLDVGDLYDQSLVQRLETTLGISYSHVADLIPRWKLTAHVPPTPESVEILPFLLHELALIRTTAEGWASVPNMATDPKPASDLGASLEHAWFGDGVPDWATKGSLEAYRNGLGRSLSEDISIAVVQNDPRMEPEREATESTYGPRERLPFDVSFYRDVSKATLRDILTDDLDFLHYIGHLDANGFECTDGSLSVEGLDRVGVDAFFLNACRSYEQGLELIQAGAIGGVVTINEVVNTEAVSVGKTLARLLHRGFPLSPAVDLAGQQSLLGDQYVVVGDGDLTVSQSKSGSVFVGHFEPRPEGFEVVLTMYPTSQKGLGSLFMPTFENEYRHYLNAGEVGPIRVSTDQAADLLEEEDAPILVDGKLHWSSELEVADLR